MMRLDTTKIKIPIGGISSVDFSKLPYSHTKSKNGKEEKNIDYATNIDFGLNRISVDNLNCEVFLDTSAKLLKDNYKQGVCLDTLEQFANEISKSGVITVDAQSLYDYGHFLSFDTTNNVSVTDIHDTINSVLMYGAVNRRYNIDEYRIYGHLGFTAARKVKTYKERLIGYCKLKEFDKDKHSRDFARQYPNMVKSFGPNDIRIESNNTSLKMIRQRCKVTTTNVGAILNSQEKVNSNTFNRIITDGQQIELFNDQYSRMSEKDIIELLGYRTVFNDLNWDWVAIQYWIKSKYRIKSNRGRNTNVYYRIKKAKKAYAMLRDTTDEMNQTIAELSRLLEAA